MTNERKYLSTKEAAEYLGVAVGTLEQWRFRRKKLPFYKLAKLVLYRKADLDAFIESHIVHIAEER